MGSVFIASFRLSPSRFNLWATSCSVLVLSLDAWVSLKNYQVTADLVRELLRIGLASGFAVIAFFVAGFSVFVSMTEKSLFMTKAVVLDEESGLSFLKRDMFSIMGFFGYLLGYLGVCLLGIFLSRKLGLISSLAVFFNFGEFAKELVVGFSYVFLGSTSIFILLQIKSFIFNVYHLMMSSILWGFKDPSRKAASPSANKKLKESSNRFRYRTKTSYKRCPCRK